jgi:hypothetical protein
MDLYPLASSRKEINPLTISGDRGVCVLDIDGAKPVAVGETTGLHVPALFAF